MKSTEDDGSSTKATVEIWIVVWEEQIKNKTLRYLPSYLNELRRKKNVFCVKK